ncbi:MAG TPA: hypothetical protein VM661_06855 [Candidatus Sulfotelmatobacter sp.]|jgi:hypothetical protein|nr:hypothetical protein [Candidatus Sulfotelmatobacter sp.]
MKRIAAKLAIAAALITAAVSLSGCAVYEQPYYGRPVYYTYGPPPPPPVYYGYAPHYWGGGGWGHGWR